MSIIQVEAITKRYRKRKSKEVVTAVQEVSFNVAKGEILGLLGPNGAGKTTTIKTICALLQPDEGRVIVNGIDNQRKRLEALRHISAVLEGNRNLYWRLSVQENLEYFAGNRGVSRRAVQENLEYFAGNRGVSRRAVKGKIDNLLTQFHLEDKAGELVNNLSRGMQQKLAIAVAMLADTEVILLDEPTLGLDIAIGYEVRDLLRQVAAEGRTIIVSTHDMPVVQALCERTVIINAGRVVVDERVENLIQLFETRAYVVSLGAPLSDEQQRHLEAAFPVSSYENGGDKSTLKVSLERSEDIYDLMEILKLERIPVEAIDRTAINFERVFMELVKPDAEGEVERVA